MPRTLVISLVALAVLALAVAGWTARGLRWTLAGGAFRRAVTAG